MNIYQPSESKNLKSPTCLQNRRHVASLTNTFHELEFIKREKFVNNIYSLVANIIGVFDFNAFFYAYETLF